MNVRIRGVNKVRVYRKRAGWRTYYYHRKTGVRLKEKPGTVAFAAEIARADTVAKETLKRTTGTWGVLVEAYRKSPEYARLAPRTRADYERVLDYLAPLNNAPIEALDAAELIAIRDRTFEQKKRRFTNHTLQVIATVMNWGQPRKLSAGYPLKGNRKIKLPRPVDAPLANRPWDDAECEAVLRHAPTYFKPAIALGMFAAMRIEDVATVTWSIYTERDGQRCLEWRQGKTGDEVWMPAAPELQEVLDAAPRTAVTIVTGVNGRSLKKAGVEKAFRTLIARLERQGLVMPGLTFHGLRHTNGKNLADLGADPRMIQSLLGHRSMAASLHYSAQASRRRGASAAVELLAEHRAKRKEST